jgi:hypothetical protein
VFKRLTLRGVRGSVLWGASDAAVLRSWVVSRSEESPTWTLTAFVVRLDTYRLRQVPLLFQAPRIHQPRGLWCFPVRTVTVDGATLTATLGPPEGM